MKETDYRVYPYRWVVLLVFMAIVAVNQIAWLSFASITTDAADYFHVSPLSVDILAMSFMIVFILMSIPASWAIDTYGIRVAVGIGAALTGAFGLLRGLLAPSYTGVLVAQIGIALGQPFLLNAITTVAARWFPFKDRATAAGLGSLSMYAGMVVGLLLTPRLVSGSGMKGMLVIYGIVAMVAAILFLIFVRERPPTPPCRPDQEERALVFDGLRGVVRKRDFVLLMLIFTVGLGVFNAVASLIQVIVSPRGFNTDQAGVTGALMVGAGILGALVLPALSDHARKRVPFLVVGVAGATLGLAGVTFANGSSYGLLLASAFALGFFLLGAGPLGFQYGAEVGYPAPEGTTNGLLLLVGQISGIAFVFAMDGLKDAATGSMTLPLVVLIGLMVLGVLLGSRLREAAPAAGRKE